MQLIADRGLKADLHIHSIYSKHKDGTKVNNNSIEKVDLLIDKLTENEVNICAITDHDTFNYEIYEKLKQVETSNSSVKKVLPGVEFSVQFSAGDENKVIHIVTIFNDNDNEKVKRIESILKFDKGKPQYDFADVAFTEDKYLSILRKIDLDIIMIAHQKNTITSTGKPGKNDALALGREKFNEFLFSEYFEAYEFRNKKNEVFNKKYIFNNRIEDNLRFITGSDCHDWSVYPNEESGRDNEFSFTYMKCLPTFKGVVMAMTDHRRIKLVNSFFNPNAISLDNIELKIGDDEISIPMSKGINVIIGDNSIGKSLLVHKLTNYIKAGEELASTVKKGYEKYLKESKVQVVSQIQSNHMFRFDMQGYVRRIFEENKIDRSEFLRMYFPEDVDTKVYRMKVENELQTFYDNLKVKFECDDLLKKLSVFKIKEESRDAASITYIDTLKSNDKNRKALDNLIKDLGELKEVLRKIESSSKILDQSDLLAIKEFKLKIDEMEKKYQKLVDKIEFYKKKINVINSFIKKHKEAYGKQISDEQKTVSDYIENKNTAILDIVNLISEGLKVKEFKPSIEKIVIEPKMNKVFEYNFISKLKISEISNEYIDELIESALKKDQKIDTSSITIEELKNAISYYPSGVSNPIDALKAKINERLDQDFSKVQSIIFDGMDKFNELSTGLDSQIYFTLLSYETKHKGIYIIDQPEDDISQKAIRDYLLDRFKNMGESRQVIMITHNPQFIVNLDVDNVIYLSKETGKLAIKSGALEYEDSQYSVLKIIADNIDGGLDTIERRLKRYEKGIQSNL